MTKIQIASLSLKLMGIFSIIQAIPILRELSASFAFKNFVQENASPSFNYLLFGILISIFLLLILGACLIFFSDNLAKKIMKENNDKLLTDVSAKDIQSIAFSIVGLVMIVIAIPKLVQLGANLQALKSAGADSSKGSISVGTWVYSIGIAVQFVIGIVLFFGAKGLSGIWHSLQKIRPMKDMK